MGYFKGIDMYGEQIGITYKGGGQFKTKVGAAVSLAIIVILCVYFGYLLFLMITRQQTIVASSEFVLDLNMEESFTPSSVGFDFAFGIGAPLDPTIGYYTVSQVKFEYTGKIAADGTKERLKTRTSVPFDTCGVEYFNFTNVTQVQYSRITDYMCLISKDY